MYQPCRYLLQMHIVIYTSFVPEYGDLLMKMLRPIGECGGQALPLNLPQSVTTAVTVWFRTLIHGDRKAGFTIFWADDGLDTGPVLLQKSCVVEPDDTVETLYNRFLYPEGIKALVCTSATACELLKPAVDQFPNLFVYADHRLTLNISVDVEYSMLLISNIVVTIVLVVRNIVTM